MSKENSAVTIRQPATANLMVDSADRNVGASPNFFTIQKPQSILNGFFNRVGTTELVLEWGTPNIDPVWQNNFWQVDISGAGAVTGNGSNTGDISGGFFNVHDWANATAAILNAAGAITTPATTWVTANPEAGFVTFTPNQPVWVRLPQTGWFNFGRLVTGTTWALIGGAGAPYLSIGGGQPAFTAGGLYHPLSPAMDLRPFRYLDFVSAQLTYNQDLKDSATNTVVRDVLARWYMHYDNQVRLDPYGFQIYMGYEAFNLRRLFNPPKQIRWDSIQPVGNLSFEVYTDQNILAPFRFGNWLMTLQVSEN